MSATKEIGRALDTMPSTQNKTLATIPPVPVRKSTQAVSAAMSEFLDKIFHWDASSEDIKQVLTAAFNAKDYRDCIENLRMRNIEPLSYINSLDKVGSCSIFEERSIHHTLAIDHRYLGGRPRITKAMRTSVEEGLWHIWASP